MINWPCILKLEGDDELIYLVGERDFITECKELILSDEDCIIDSTGTRYLIESKLGEVVLNKASRILDVEEVTDLVRANEFQKAELCLTKIHFLSVSEAIQALCY
jgi:hypothetical protein